jgi:hypothetical protein
MFTADNFRRIYDSENRKGRDLAKEFFPSLEPHTLAVKNKVVELKQLRAIKPPAATFAAQVSVLKKAIGSLKAKKSAAIDAELETISSNVLSSAYKISLTKSAGPKGKDVYIVDGSAESYFVVKQLQKNLNALYDVKQANRHELVCQVRDTIAGRFPLELVRTDIANFYETVDRKGLLLKLEADQLLSPSSKKYIKQILDAFGHLSGSAKGIPRGVGVSAYLAELYLRPIDREIRAMPGLVLYCRYVDDIVALFARPPIGPTLGAYNSLVSNALSKHGLVQNSKKTFDFDLAGTGPFKFEYLGYRFCVEKTVRLAPSAAKIRKCRARVRAAFGEYVSERVTDPRKAYRNLVARLKFLTGNTRLLNSKSGAVTGLWYNNALADDIGAFELLDKRLKTRIAALTSTKLQKRLKKLTFVSGFTNRRFHNFSTRELQNIVRVWNHG